MQQEPRDASLFDTVPEPMIDPAPRTRVFAACAINCGKENVMSSPAFGAPNTGAGDAEMIQDWWRD